jgi:mannose-1-phosphate guanylyltransferase
MTAVHHPISTPLIPVILSGGAGSRLWPISRQHHPKPFMKLSDGETLLQKAFKRAAYLSDVTEILTVTNREFYFKSEEEYRVINQNKIPTSYILESEGRNTAAAIAAATLYIEKKHGPKAILLVLTADHLIDDKAAFSEAVLQAKQLAKQNKIVTFGITPSGPETGYGYIEHDQHEVKRFVEKPNRRLAEQYIAAGNYLWNAGLFCFQAQTMLAEFKTHAPNIIETVQECINVSQLAESADHHFSQLELDPATFKNTPNISIDCAIMEKSSNIAVVPCDIKWTDIGSWDAFGELKDVDSNANSVVGEALLYDVSNCYVQSHNRIIGAVGIKNLIIVDTPDALLVADRSRSQDVKHIVDKLKDSGHSAYKLHTTIQKSWGIYTILEENSHFKVKRITVKPGCTIPLHAHQHKDEQWTIASGTAEITYGEISTLARTGNSFFIPSNTLHSIKNSGLIDLIIIEVQTGQYLGEDDRVFTNPTAISVQN